MWPLVVRPLDLVKSEVGKISFKTVYLLETTTTNLADGKEDMINAEPSMENELLRHDYSVSAVRFRMAYTLIG